MGPLSGATRITVPADTIRGMGNTKIVAGIVTFNPDISRLRENVQAVIDQVDQVVIVDNATRDSRALEALASEFSHLHLIRNRENGGVAKALNQAMGWASERGAEWAVLLDQDSVCGDELVQTLSRNAGPGVAIVAPAIRDRNRANADAAEVRDVNYCITSGSMCSVAVWSGVGGYDESLFIDFADFDYCLRVRAEGHRIVRNPDAELLHEIGHITKHGPFTAYHHSAFRLRHMARDMLYYARKHRRSPAELKVQGRGTAGTYMVLARKAFVIAGFERDKIRKLYALTRGVVG